jgi:FkbM family methyltransferase
MSRKITQIIHRFISEPTTTLQAVDNRYLHWNMLFRLLAWRGLVRRDKTTGTYVRDVHGHMFHLNPGDIGISRDLAHHGTRERESVDTLSTLIDPDMTILDIGANIGFYTLIEAAAVNRGKGHVIAVEPAPENVRLLQLNVNTNNYQKDVTVVQGAVTAENGTVSLALSNRSNLHKLSSLCSSRDGIRHIDVPAFTVQSLVETAGRSMSSLGCVRMDVEGAEYTILPSLTQHFARPGKHILFVEFHPSLDPEGHQRTVRGLEEIGFQCLSATKEYGSGRKVQRQHFPDARVEQLYADEVMLRPGGCEAFLIKE